tara:strand:- start:882 stop:1535 length:654 start_codon:yes stop_codon:yes gene_type:complete
MSILVISQGLLGWYMVQSGLVDIPRVSHFRLASHLFLALLLLQFIIWTFLSIDRKKIKFSRLSFFSIVWTFLLGIQILYGAFMAGLKAGWGYNTYPLMGNKFLPEAAFIFKSFTQNIFYNPVMIQFIHRHFPIILFILFLILGIKILRSYKNKIVHFFVISTFLVFVIQFILGVLTLVWVVPIFAASIHQLMAVILLTSSICLNYFLLYNSNSSMKN